MSNFTTLNSGSSLSQSISALTSQIAVAGGVARSNRFRVYLNAANIINGPLQTSNVGASLSSLDTSGRLTLFAYQAELPARLYNANTNRYYGPDFQRPFQATYSPIIIEFLVGADMAEKYFFDAWHSIIENPATQNLSYPKDYMSIIEINQLSDITDLNGNDIITYSCKLYDAWPIGIDNLTVADDKINEAHKMRVTFSYRRWENNLYQTESGSNNNGPSSSFNPSSNPLGSPKSS